MVDCANCIEKCPQAATANEIAKGRMFAEREFMNLINKIENGTLVEVVRCKDCKNRDFCRTSNAWAVAPSDDWFCPKGERKGGDE